MIDSSLSLELADVELSRGGRVLIDGLSLSLHPGQLGLLMGPNGTGKTSLLRAIAGLARPGRGSIRFDGTELAALTADARRAIAYQGHLEGLKKDLTVEENLIFISQIWNSSETISDYLAELGLRDFAGRLVRQLSAGQKRRVALAGLGIRRARLWLLDEPLTNLDADGRALVGRWLDRHLADGGMALAATHSAPELERPGCLLVEL